MTNKEYNSYALDDEGRLVNINDVRDESGKTYRCPYCDNEMIRKYGNTGRRPHFAHKVNTDRCSYDNYLHSVAEIVICDWFNRSDEIMLKHEVMYVCPKRDGCKWVVNKESDYGCDYGCSEQGSEMHNLKSWFKTCEREKRYTNEQGDRFVADLFCHNIKRDDEPLFIEIYVTHECEIEKKNSDIKIIEFHIRSEDDIQRIIKDPYICENEYTKFYNFKRCKASKNPLEIRLSKFIVYPSLKCYIDRFKFTCQDYDKKRLGIYEITFAGDNNCGYEATLECEKYTMAVAMAIQDGYIQCNCSLCKYHVYSYRYNENICKLYKLCGYNKYCRHNDVSKCTTFRIDEDLYGEWLRVYDEYYKTHYVEIWRQPRYLY